jgi:hypothetical protein
MWHQASTSAEWLDLDLGHSQAVGTAKLDGFCTPLPAVLKFSGL